MAARKSLYSLNRKYVGAFFADLKDKPRKEKAVVCRDRGTNSSTGLEYLEKRHTVTLVWRHKEDYVAVVYRYVTDIQEWDWDRPGTWTRPGGYLWGRVRIHTGGKTRRYTLNDVFSSVFVPQWVRSILAAIDTAAPEIKLWEKR